MKGYPKHLNSKTDYLYVKDHFPKEKWQPDFQALLDNRMQWLNAGPVALESGITDATHEVRTLERDGKAPEYYQYEYKEDSNCQLFRLGFTVQEIQDFLK